MAKQSTAEQSFSAGYKFFIDYSNVLTSESVMYSANFASKFMYNI